MTSSKCLYRSKHQVIIQITVSIYRPETLYITQNKHGMLFTGTRIHIAPNSAYLRRFGGDLCWFAYNLQGWPRQMTTAQITTTCTMCDLIVYVLSVQLGDSMERYPERCFHIIVPGQPKFDFNTSSISPLYETSYKNMISYIKQIKIMSMPQ